MAIARLTVFQVLSQQEILNVYHYATLNPITPDVANGLAVSFLAEVVPALQPIQSNSLGYRAVEVVDAENPAGIALRVTTSLSGTVAGELFPTFAAWSFKANVATRATRPGGKRIAGVTETQTSDGRNPAANILTLFIAAANALAATLDWNGGQDTAIPIVVSYNRVPGLPPSIRETQGITSYSLPVISSQTSRKIGRGS